MADRGRRIPVRMPGSYPRHVGEGPNHRSISPRRRRQSQHRGSRESDHGRFGHEVDHAANFIQTSGADLCERSGGRIDVVEPTAAAVQRSVRRESDRLNDRASTGKFIDVRRRAVSGVDRHQALEDVSPVERAVGREIEALQARAGRGGADGRDLS